MQVEKRAFLNCHYRGGVDFMANVVGNTPPPWNQNMRARRPLRQPHYIKNHDAIEEAIAGSIRQYVEAGLAKDTAMRSVQQLVVYTLLYNRDLSCVLEDLDEPPSPAHANLYGRLVILLADECFAKMTVLIGKDLRAAMDAWNTPPEVRLSLSQCGKEFRLLRKDEEPWVNELRDNVIAHRDLAVAKQWRLIYELDIAHAQALATRLMEWTNSLYGVVNAIIAARVDQLRRQGPAA